MDLFHYRFLRRGIEVHSEIVCQRHRDEMSAEGGFMAPVTAREEAAGVKQTFSPYTAGDRPCAVCAEESERKGAA